MRNNYLAQRADFLAIEEALRYVWDSKLDFIFRDKAPVRATIIVSFDSEFIYLWTRMKLSGLISISCQLKNYFAYKILHQLSITEELQRAWHAGLLPEIENLLPKLIKDSSVFVTPRIGGGLLTPFLTLQKSLKQKHNPYTTRQSYLATIVHEFGHVYWNQYKLWRYSDKLENLRYLKTAKRLYKNKAIISPICLRPPVIYGVSELFAACTELSASELFWPEHKRNFDAFAADRLKNLILEEVNKDLDRENSVLKSARYPHDFAIVFGKILLTLYPKTWPKILLTRAGITINCCPAKT